MAKQIERELVKLLEDNKMEKPTVYFEDDFSLKATARGGYFGGKIYINVNECNSNPDTISATIIHEYIHFLLDVFFGRGVSRQFDNIAYSAYSSIVFDRYLDHSQKYIPTVFIQ